MRILHLTLKRKWFLEIAFGKKRCEYRLVKPYWIARLLYREFDEIHFRNGYRADSPFMRVECKQIETVRIDDIHYFCISIGDILEVKNINLLSYPDPWLTEISIGMQESGFVSGVYCSKLKGGILCRSLLN